MPAPPAAVWIDARLVVRESPIEGCGLSAGEHIRSGTVVLRLGGRLVSSTELQRRYRGHWVPALDQRIAGRHRRR